MIRTLCVLLALVLALHATVRAEPPSSTLEARIEAHEAADLWAAVAALRRQQLAALKAASPGDELTVAFAEAGLAYAIEKNCCDDVPGIEDEGRQLMAHAAPIIARRIDPRDPRIRKLAFGYYWLIYKQPGFETLESSIKGALGEQLPAVRLPTAKELATIAEGNVGEDYKVDRNARRRAADILAKTLGPTHLAIAQYLVATPQAESNDGVDPIREEGFRLFAKIDRAKAFGEVRSYLAKILENGRNDEADRLVRDYFADAPDEQAVALMGSLATSHRKEMKALIAPYYAERIAKLKLSPFDVAVIEAESFNIFKVDLARKALALASESMPIDLSRAYASLLLAEALNDKPEKRTAPGEAYEQAAVALPALFAAHGPDDKRVARAWAALRRGAADVEDPAIRSFGALPSDVPRKRLPTPAESKRSAGLIAKAKPAEQPTIAVLTEAIAAEVETLGPDHPSTLSHMRALGLAEAAAGLDTGSAAKAIAAIARHDGVARASTVATLLDYVAILLSTGQDVRARNEVRSHLARAETETLQEVTARQLATGGVNRSSAVRKLLAAELAGILRRPGTALATIDEPTFATDLAEAVTIEQIEARALEHARQGRWKAADEDYTASYKLMLANLPDERTRIAALARLYEVRHHAGTLNNADRAAFVSMINVFALSGAADVDLFEAVADRVRFVEDVREAALGRAYEAAGRYRGPNDVRTAMISTLLAGATRGSDATRRVARVKAVADLLAVMPVSVENRDRLLNFAKDNKSSGTIIMEDTIPLLAAWMMDRKLEEKLADDKPIAEQIMAEWFVLSSYLSPDALFEVESALTLSLGPNHKAIRDLREQRAAVGGRTFTSQGWAPVDPTKLGEVDLERFPPTVRPPTPSERATLNAALAPPDTSASVAHAEPDLPASLRIAKATFGPRHPVVAELTIELMNRSPVADRAIADDLAQAYEIIRDSYGPTSHKLEGFLLMTFDYYSPDKFGDMSVSPTKDLSRFYLTRQIELYTARGSLGDVADLQSLYGADLGVKPRELDERALRAAVKASRVDVTANPQEVRDREDALYALYRTQKRPAEAEPFALAALDRAKASFGDEAPSIIEPLVDYGDILFALGRKAEAQVRFEAAVAVAARFMGDEAAITGLIRARIARLSEAPAFPKRLIEEQEILADGASGGSPGTVLAANRLPMSEEQQGEINQLFQDLRERIARADWAGAAGPSERLLLLVDSLIARGIDAPQERALSQRARVLGVLDRQGESDGLLRRLLALAESDPADLRGLAEASQALAASLDRQGRAEEAAPLHRRAFAIAALLQLDFNRQAPFIKGLASNLERRGQYRDAEILRREIVRLGLADDPDDPSAADAIALVTNLKMQGREQEAEQMLAAIGTPFDSIFERIETSKDAPTLEAGARMMLDLERPLAAVRLAEVMVALQTKGFGPNTPAAARARNILGQALLAAGKAGDATRELEGACAILAEPGRAVTSSEEAERRSLEDAGICARDLTLGLWQIRGSRPDAEALAFAMTQRSELSDAGIALSRAGARAAARAAGAPPTIEQFEAALIERRGLDQAFTEALSVPDGGETQRQLIARRIALDHRVSELVSDVRDKYPRYWDMRSPEPIGLAELGTGTPTDRTLLRPDEALIQFLVPPGKAKGLVFAVTRDAHAWAELGWSGDQIREAIARLRRQIDPYGYGVEGRGMAIGAFDRDLAHQLYLALLGDRQIQSVIGPSPTWMFVLSGPLTSLPPGLLVAAPPSGSDVDQADLRATDWVIRRRAVSVLPATASLRTLRQLIPAPAAAAMPLLSFADPDFGSDEAEAPPVSPQATSTIGRFFRDGRGNRESLKKLERLPATRDEARELARVLKAPASSMFFDLDASEARLRSLNESGALGRARVVHFATHGLVAGDIDGLVEPSLAFALPPDGSDTDRNDGLLTASETLELSLDAEWVLLSACNTASPDGRGAKGLSGLVRSFFFAGTRTVLASHWQVNDRAAQLLVNGLFERAVAGESKVRALQRAQLALLDSPSVADAANPNMWAPFVVYGTPD